MRAQCRAFGLWGHAQCFIGATHEAKERAISAFSRNEIGRVLVSAVKSVLLHIEAEAVLLLFRSMAFVAVFLKDRLHLADEIDRCDTWQSHGKREQECEN